MINDLIVKWVAMKFAILSTDCCTAIYFTTGITGLGQTERWQLAIDTISRLHKSNMIESEGSCGEPCSQHDWKVYLERLASNDPFDRNFDRYAVWIERDFCGTDLLREAVLRFELNKEEADWIGFESYIDKLFCANGDSSGSFPLRR